MPEVELATLKWVDWLNNQRLSGPIGNIPPKEAEARYYAGVNALDMAAWLTIKCLGQSRCGSYRVPQIDSQRAAPWP